MSRACPTLMLQERLNAFSASINALHLVHRAYAFIDPIGDSSPQTECLSMYKGFSNWTRTSSCRIYALVSRWKIDIQWQLERVFAQILSEKCSSNTDFLSWLDANSDKCIHLLLTTMITGAFLNHRNLPWPGIKGRSSCTCIKEPRGRKW
ncbi:hypothetical protein POM88_044865 [Heracleum sosnowskyi]|uniref:Uncharacterized protein n=1 Tax=Heracleum sosnowskyi TaxID=360622 RepID=A0AAD8M4C8_9APIA|nr:hypothetical protein POM88_044865 [Heracleum sosnowskyi]